MFTSHDSHVAATHWARSILNELIPIAAPDARAYLAHIGAGLSLSHVLHATLASLWSPAQGCTITRTYAQT